jgi:hypothetical protein
MRTVAAVAAVAAVTVAAELRCAYATSAPSGTAASRRNARALGAAGCKAGLSLRHTDERTAAATAVAAA